MRRFISIFLLFFPLVLSSCQGQSANTFQSQDKIKVLCTIAMISDLVEQIGGEHVEVVTLVTGELDPHTYELVKGDDEKFAAADVVFFNGLGLEHGPSLRTLLEKNPKTFALGDQIQSTNPELILHVDQTVDPHIWMDISLWARTVPQITRILSEQDPSHADDFRTNAEKLWAEMESADLEARNALQNIPSEKRYLVTSHDAFNYFCRRYLAQDGEEQEAWTVRCAAPEPLAPDSQISSTDIQEIVKHVEKYQVEVIFPESNVSKDSLNKIVDVAQKKGLNLRVADVTLYGDAMGPKGSDAETHRSMILHNAHAIAENLEGPDSP